MNKREAKKLLKKVSDPNLLPLKVLRINSKAIQERLSTDETRFGVVCFDFLGGLDYYSLSQEQREKITDDSTLIEYTHKWEKWGEPESVVYEKDWQPDPFLLNNPPRFFTGGGSCFYVLKFGGCGMRNMLEKEYNWLMGNLGKYTELSPGISVLKKDLYGEKI